MSRRRPLLTRRQPGVGLAALGVLAAAGWWPLASMAQTAHTAAPLPARPPAATAASAPRPSVATRAAPAAVLPAAWHGSWEPLSRALASLGTVTLAAQTVQWSICGAAPHAVMAAQEPVAPAAPPPGTQEAGGATTPALTALLAPSGPPGCTLDGTRLSHLRLAQPDGQPCELEVSLYENAAALAQNERLAWGVLQRRNCPAAP
ncbi:hypothetical protein EII20_03595 [Comamonadaceae bacterium OH2545_COT-014]|nr:hypothetical protein EII20_03595 [Comamonadaceae bacterium OH2545_COT-014]